MKRLHTLIAAAAAAAIAVSGIVSPVQGAIPEYQRVIKARSASADAAVTQGCLETRFWISSSANVFGGHPGPISKQGLTSVLVQRYDTCAVADRAGGGAPPGVLVFEGMGQTLYSLGSTPRFTLAWVQTTVPVLDEVSGATVPVRLDLTWRPSEPYQRENRSSHARDPHAGIVNAHSQTLMADAWVTGTVVVGDEEVAWPSTGEASLEQVKYGCQLIRHPHGSTDFAC